MLHPHYASHLNARKKADYIVTIFECANDQHARTLRREIIAHNWRNDHDEMLPYTAVK